MRLRYTWKAVLFTWVHGKKLQTTKSVKIKRGQTLKTEIEQLKTIFRCCDEIFATFYGHQIFKWNFTSLHRLL